MAIGTLTRTSAHILAARTISAVMQPTVTIIPLLALFNGFHEPRVTVARWLVWCCATITCAATLPAILFVVMLKRGTITDLYVSNRNERPLAYGVMILCYIVGTELTIRVVAPRRTMLLMAAMTLCLIIGAGVNQLVCKFSLHAMSAAVAAVALPMAYGAAFLPVLLVIGAVGWARLTLRAHTPGEISAGAFVGAVVGMLVFTML
ncbi:MAG: hypothetical protein M3176_04555 [Chloroflexota bacterium]|nr:hypothetical protein [Chloroflexota bacterium]MDQ6906082.1 hypothetical protein [Chloroflexota bacterium]